MIQRQIRTKGPERKMMSGCRLFPKIHAYLHLDQHGGGTPFRMRKEGKSVKQDLY